MDIANNNIITPGIIPILIQANGSLSQRAVNEFISRGVNDVFRGKNSAIDNSINAINTQITKSLSTESGTVAAASFLQTNEYVKSYRNATEKFLEEVKHRQKLIEMGNVYLAEFGVLKNKADNHGVSSMTLGMKDFLDFHKIPYDKYKNDLLHDKDEWEINMEALNSWIKSRSNEVQTDITKLNDIINKQNQIVQSQATILKKVLDASENFSKNML